MKKLLYLLVFTTVLYPQQNQKIIAKIGNISISENEFKIRYELVPKVNSPADATGLTSKKNFLYGLITEKLLSMGARENGLDTIESVMNTINYFEKMFIRDGLYKKVVVEKSRKYADSLLSFYLEASPMVKTKFIVNKDSSNILKIWKMLNKGVPFDTIFDGLSKYEKDTSTIYLGQLEDNAERQLFTLHEKSTSKPIKIDDGWYIFNIERKNEPANKRSASWESDFKQLQKAAKTKAEDKLYRQYMNKFFSDKKIEANGYLLKSLAEKVCEIFAEKEKTIIKGKNLFLETADVVKIESLFGKDSLHITFVKIPGKDISFRDYLRWYKFENFSAGNSTYRAVAGLLNGKTKKFIEQELLYSEGRKEGIQKNAEVQSDINMWKDSYLSQVMSSVFYDSVKINEEDVQNLNRNKDSVNTFEVNIVEVLTDNLETVEEVLNGIRSGKDLHDLADRFSMREAFKNNRGESGFVLSSSLGEIGRIAENMNVNEVYGPVKLSEGYSVFKLIAKRKTEQKNHVSNQSPEEIKGQLYYKKVRERINNYTQFLAEKYKIEINEQELSGVQLTKITSLVYRNLGFGGRITAVPFNSSDIEWVKKYKEKNNL